MESMAAFRLHLCNAGGVARKCLTRRSFDHTELHNVHSVNRAAPHRTLASVRARPGGGGGSRPGRAGPRPRVSVPYPLRSLVVSLPRQILSRIETGEFGIISLGFARVGLERVPVGKNRVETEVVGGGRGGGRQILPGLVSDGCLLGCPVEPGMPPAAPLERHGGGAAVPAAGRSRVAVGLPFDSAARFTWKSRAGARTGAGEEAADVASAGA